MVQSHPASYNFKCNFVALLRTFSKACWSNLYCGPQMTLPYSSKGLTNALNNSGKVKMFSTAKLFLIITSFLFSAAAVSVWWWTPGPRSCPDLSLPSPAWALCLPSCKHYMGFYNLGADCHIFCVKSLIKRQCQFDCLFLLCIWARSWKVVTNWVSHNLPDLKAEAMLKICSRILGHSHSWQNWEGAALSCKVRQK